MTASFDASLIYAKRSFRGVMISEKKLWQLQEISEKYLQQLIHISQGLYHSHASSLVHHFISTLEKYWWELLKDVLILELGKYVG